MPTKLQDVEKAEKAYKLLQAKVKKLKTEAGDLERTNTQMTTRSALLVPKLEKAEAELQHLTGRIVQANDSLRRLDTDAKALEAKVDSLETTRAEKALQLADIHAELNDRKTSIDRELEAYSLSKKQEIRDQILAVNEQLGPPKAELATIQEQITAKTEELRLLNLAAIQEQDDIKLSRATVDSDLVSKQEEVGRVQVQVDSTKKDLQKLFFERDNAMLTIQKAKDEHQKYVDYENKSRKILDAKDRELQERESELQTKGQFLQNRRTFLPPL